MAEIVVELCFSPVEWQKLSHRERRKHVNKVRRKFRRIAVAKQKEKAQGILEEESDYLEQLCEDERRLEDEERRREALRLLQDAAWLETERMAQEEFKKKKQIEDQRRKEKEDREKLIREEWESLQRKEKEAADVRDRERKEKEEKRKEALQLGEAPRNISSGFGTEPWHNPILPATLDYGDPLPKPKAGDRPSQQCSFFLKTGACRYGDRCSRAHARPTSSNTLLVPNMYASLALREQLLNERGQEGALEHDADEAYEDFRNFYYDVLEEFSTVGKVVQFKVSYNQEAHLRGNVYVQYSSEEECNKAYQMFNGRWYAQKQLSCQLCPVTRWKSAICGLANQNRCPKGRNCNFLHVYRNPGGAFARADRDLSPPPSHHSSHRQSEDRSRSPRFRSRSRSPHRRRRSYWHRGHSESRDRHRQRHRNGRSRSRSRSGDRRWHRRSRSRERLSQDYRRSRASRSRSSSGSSSSNGEDGAKKRKHSSNSGKKPKKKSKKKKMKKKDHKHKHKHSHRQHHSLPHSPDREESRRGDGKDLEGTADDEHLERNDQEEKNDQDKDRGNKEMRKDCEYHLENKDVDNNHGRGLDCDQDVDEEKKQDKDQVKDGCPYMDQDTEQNQRTSRIDESVEHTDKVLSYQQDCVNVKKDPSATPGETQDCATSGETLDCATPGETQDCTECVGHLSPVEDYQPSISKEV